MFGVVQGRAATGRHAVSVQHRQAASADEQSPLTCGGDRVVRAALSGHSGLRRRRRVTYQPATDAEMRTSTLIPQTRSDVPFPAVTTASFPR
jgi:hypothetical protein